MQEYPVKPGHAKKTDLEAVLTDSFGAAVHDGEWLTASQGAFEMVKARYDGLKKLVVDTVQRADVDSEVAMRTIRSWNVFLEAATGYNAKMRGKKAQQAAKKTA